MQNQLKSMLNRKLTATFVATIVTSICMAFWGLKDPDSEIIYNLGNAFAGSSAIYIMYVGGIIFTYGNLVSVGIEYLQRKWFQKHDWLYIFLHGIFGAALGLVVLDLLDVLMLLYGTPAALLYACVDRWLYKRASKNKAAKMFLLIPLLVYGLCWGYFQFITPPIPPFTKADAVDFATAGNGTVTDVFPNKIGKWKGTIKGYEVERKTSAKEMEEETYIVTFKENWRKGAETGSWLLSYKVECGSSSVYDEKGEIPPYHE
ncbi:hypothetical protein NLX67_15970 [Domibacillus sp. A3M-37]|uniref:hypothetical protein n=1 Tax=Domibacillus sp. A3M-37 TaxID=2962037 RepID=UPI0020B8A44C|nr:hypothetical protein [Domibacillus sp. A3M-37]MCP3763869.1 hypothetical protein [Domibacillus sp. A3M-37]